jgi:hypothetical protein
VLSYPYEALAGLRERRSVDLNNEISDEGREAMAMRDARSHPPMSYRIINALCKPLVAAGLPGFRLDESSVCVAASKQTGLTDFGDPYYRQGLLRLLESAEQDANLHPLGRFMVRNIVVNYLVQRLRLIETRKTEPQVFEGSLRPPLLVTGLGRSGTTFLHNMLAVDPAHRALPQWLLYRPFPDERRSDDGPDSRIAKMEQDLRLRQPLFADLDAKHYVRADTYEECILALGLTFNSLIFSTLLPVWGYIEWYLKRESSVKKYREYRWLLQYFQSQEDDRRLAVKAPAHSGNLEALLQAVPEALVIQTHRDPVACVASACSLISTFNLAVTDEIDLRRMTSLMLDWYELWSEHNLAFRAEHPGVIYDVYYDALVSDPIGTVQGIYSHFGLPWTDVYASELASYIDKNPKDKHGKHRYAASDYGLTEAEIARRLERYIEHFGF